nr:inorganic pyrophosphatase Ppa [Desulfobulbaceae bacterium]
MPMTKFLQEPKKLDLQPYKKPKKNIDLRQTHVPFSGSPHNHPYDSTKFILVADPYCTSIYYEFESKDVEFAEELPSIVNIDGEAVNMVLIWVSKDSIGLRCTPFIVNNTTPRPDSAK